MTTQPDPDGLMIVGDVVVLPDEPVKVKRSWWRRLLARLFG